MELWSSSYPLLIALSIALAASVLFLLLHGRHGGQKNALPPGPPALLFVARFLALRRSVFHLGPLLRDLHARYGPVVSVRLSRTLVFVADRGIAHRVLVQGGATFADRPPLGEPGLLFTSGGRDMSTSPYGAYWRMVRRNLATEALHPARVALYAPARRRASDSIVRDLLGQPGGVAVRPAFRRAMFELLVYMSLGARLAPEALDEVQELQMRMLRSITSFPIFSFFPSLTKRLFRRRWAGYVAVRRRQEEIFLPLIRARRERDRDGGPPCYADSLLALRVSDEGGRPLTDAETLCLCSEFLTGGTDTTVTSLKWIMAELVNRPDIQSKVYEEVKAKPELDDDLQAQQQATPYLKAVVLEGLRLHPPAHFLLPHGVQSDGAEVGGHAVPKGAEVNFLVADFGRGEAAWTAAREFRPERFLEGGEGHGVVGVDGGPHGEQGDQDDALRRRSQDVPRYTLGLLHVEYFVGHLVRELEWLPVTDGDEVDMTEELDFTTVMKHPLRARLVPRTS